MQPFTGRDSKAGVGVTVSQSQAVSPVKSKHKTIALKGLDLFLVSSGRVVGTNLHPEVVTFSMVVSSDMAPGFHVLGYITTQGF